MFKFRSLFLKVFGVSVLRVFVVLQITLTKQPADRKSFAINAIYAIKSSNKCIN